MGESKRCKTVDGGPPNGGMPTNVMLAAANSPPQRDYQALQVPPPYHTTQAPYIPTYNPPVKLLYGMPMPPFECFASYPTAIPRCPAPQLQPPGPQTQGQLSWAPNPDYEAPGQTFDGHALKGDGWSYLFPKKHTTIFFVHDRANGYPPKLRYSKHRVPCCMSVRELLGQLGAPHGDNNGVTEVHRLGHNRWDEGRSFTQGSQDSTKNLWQVGWTERRGDDNPVWLVVKK